MLVLGDNTPLDNITELKIVEKSNTGDKELSFVISTNDLAYAELAEEKRILLQGDDYYNIKAIEQAGESASVTCRLDLDVFLVGGVLGYSKTETLYSLLAFCLTGTDWRQEGAETITGTTLNELEAGNVYDLMDLAQKNYGVVLRCDTRDKVVRVIKAGSGKNKGCYFTDELNLSDLSLRGDSYEICTRIIPIGAEGLRIDDVNGGKNYVDNHQYCNKIITRVWKDERYTDKQHLKDAAIEYLKVHSVPTRVYDGSVINLAGLSEEYQQLKFSVGDIITLVDSKRGARADYEIVAHTRYPYEPERDTVEINAAAPSYSQVIQGLADTTQQMFVSDRKKISSITQDIDGIYVEVSDRYTKGETDSLVSSQIQAEAGRVDVIVAEQQTTINGLTTTQTEQSSQISLLSTGMELKVSKNDVISAINMSPESIIISADRIQLDGQTFTNGTFNWLNDTGILYGSIWATDVGDGNFNAGLVIDSQKAITLQGSYGNPEGAEDSIRLIADYGNFRAWSNHGSMNLFSLARTDIESQGPIQFWGTKTINKNKFIAENVIEAQGGIKAGYSIISENSLGAGGYALNGDNGRIFGNLYSRVADDDGNGFYRVAMSCNSKYPAGIYFDPSRDRFSLQAFDGDTGDLLFTQYL